MSPASKIMKFVLNYIQKNNHNKLADESVTHKEGLSEIPMAST